MNFQTGLQGSIITSQMLAGKQQIGYAGDMPSITATTKPNIRDIRIVGTLGLSHDQCHTMVVRKDAPAFRTQQEAVKWMDGKRVASPHGSCSDRFARESFEQLKVRPASYLNQSFEVILSSFETGKLDAASIWEPPAAKLVEEGLARRVATGNMNDLRTSAFLLMSKELIDKRPDVVEGWLKAELEAQQFYADPKNDGGRPDGGRADPGVQLARDVEFVPQGVAARPGRQPAGHPFGAALHPEGLEGAAPPRQGGGVPDRDQGDRAGTARRRGLSLIRRQGAEPGRRPERWHHQVRARLGVPRRGHVT
ncbi:MAG: hypothetical protein M3P93_00335 [Actinomycetota bacterium]|nr:hypothetical protein [Actinomycetota bacterium]